MPTSLDSVVSFMNEQGYSHTIRSDGPEPMITTAFRTSQYRDTDGDQGVQLVIRLRREECEYLHISAPNAYDLSECQHKAAALEALAGIQWRMNLVSFKYDSEDGEIRPYTGISIEDATLTGRQLHWLLLSIPRILDRWHGCMVRAMETGVVDFETPADATPESVSFDSLPEFTELSEGAATIIGQCETDLELSGLESITVDDVRALNRKPWGGNDSSWSTYDLDLGGLKTLPLDVAEALAHRFDGLPESMSPATLKLNGIESLSVDVANAIAGYPGELHLNGLQSMDVGVATALATHSADLNLDGLTTLGADAAQAIMGHSGNISLDGLTEISDAVAAHLLAAPAASDDENQVTITRAFELGKTVVTQQQWILLMGRSYRNRDWGSEVLETTPPWGVVEVDDDGDEVQGTPEGDNYPAVWVSWDDATEFCAKLTALEHKSGKLSVNQTYRLPTEAEWEYACRAGTTTAYSFGDAESKLGDYAWYDDNSGDEPHEVATKKPNPWGLFDMHGNAWEWCEDWHEDSLSGGNDPKGPSAGSDRVIRGGCWNNYASCCRSADRRYSTPTNRSCYNGFRIVRVLL